MQLSCRCWPGWSRSCRSQAGRTATPRGGSAPNSRAKVSGCCWRPQHRLGQCLFGRGHVTDIVEHHVTHGDFVAGRAGQQPDDVNAPRRSSWCSIGGRPSALARTLPAAPPREPAQPGRPRPVCGRRFRRVEVSVDGFSSASAAICGWPRRAAAGQLPVRNSGTQPGIESIGPC